MNQARTETVPHMTRLVILAPNWLGDAVMALPAIADVRRQAPRSSIAVAARAPIAPLFHLVPGIEEVITIERRGWREIGAALSSGGFDTALLLPNSFHTALVAWRAGIAGRWGYRGDWRGGLLTRAVAPPSGLHQVEYYQQLVHALGFPNGPIEPRVTVPAAARDAARSLLTQAGWDGTRPLAAIAPGAAYGGAKRWPPERFAALAAACAADGVQTVMVGSAADRVTTDEVARALARAPGRGSAPALVDLAGRTDLATLAGVLVLSRALITNDSGGMHLGAAVGTPTTAVFGPTDERATRPIGDAHTVVTGSAWCRPCMLRECPLDHRCMRGIEVAPVAAAALRTL
jgi:heptosyltransferase-2